MDKIRLIFKGMSEIIGGEVLGLIVLTDTASTRQLTIVCDKQMEYQFGLRMNATPITDMMLPEVLCKMAGIDGDSGYELLIYDIKDGQYKAMLTDTKTAFSAKVRASDAVLLSFISSIPLYMERTLMARQSVPFTPNSGGMSIPVNAISDEMLRQALDNAVKEENYELASHLRDELNRREENNKNKEG